MTKQLGAKVYLLEKKAVRRKYDREFDEEYDDTETERLLFASPEKLGYDVERIFWELEVNEDTRRWNDYGDEWRVEEHCARACQLYEAFTDCDNLKTLCMAYGINIEIPERLKHWEQWHHEDMEKTKLHEKTFEGILDKLRNEIHFRLPKNGFRLKFRHRDNSTEYKLTVVDLATDFIHAPGVVLDETSNDRANKKWEKYYKSEQYKIDQEEEAQLRSERATYMGENGFSNFSCDGEKTYFW